MFQATFRHGEFLIAVEIDHSIGDYVGSVVNKPYGITLRAESPVLVRKRFVALLDQYLSDAMATDQIAA